MFGSVEQGIGWGDAGPEPGYFPFYIGLMLSAASVANGVLTVVRWQALSIAFVSRSAFRQVLSVFIPTAFIPGISGQLYAQFAVAVSVSMIISAINALTLSPALCSLILKHRKKPTGVMGWMQSRIDKTRDGYTKVVTPMARRGIVALLLVVGFAAATGGIGSMVPSGFLPDEDQGAFMAEVQLPDAASTNRTLAAVEEVEKTIANRPWKQSVFTVSGYSLIDGLALPNRALVVVELK
eukprot:gene46557-58048_t